jgi:hypothetical protein
LNHNVKKEELTINGGGGKGAQPPNIKGIFNYFIRRVEIEVKVDYNSQDEMKRQRDEKEVKDGKEEKKEKKQKEEEKKEKEEKKKEKEKNIVKKLVASYFDDSLELGKLVRSLNSSDVESLKLLCSKAKSSLDLSIEILEHTAKIKSKIKSIFKNTKNNRELFPWKEEWLHGIEKWLNSIKLNNIECPQDVNDIDEYYYLTLGPNVYMVIDVEGGMDCDAYFKIYSLLDPKSKICNEMPSDKYIKRKDEFHDDDSEHHLKSIFLYWYKELFPKADLFSKEIVYESSVPPFNLWVKYMVELFGLFSSVSLTSLRSECDNPPTLEETNLIRNSGLLDYSALNSNVVWWTRPLIISPSLPLSSSLTKSLGDTQSLPLPMWIRVPNSGGFCNGAIISSEKGMSGINYRILEKIVLDVFFNSEINTRKLKFSINGPKPILDHWYATKNYSWKFMGFSFSLTLEEKYTKNMELSIYNGIYNRILLYEEIVTKDGQISIKNRFETYTQDGGQLKQCSPEQIISFAKWILLTTVEIDTILARCNKETKASFEKDYLLKHTSIGKSTIREKQVENLIFSQLPKDVGKIILNDYVESFRDQPPDDFIKSVQELFLKGI